MQSMYYDPIIVHQMGKVGSKTVELSLRKTYDNLGIKVPIYHTHALNGFELGRQKAFEEKNQRDPASRLAALEYGEGIRKQIDANPAQHWNIISLVRDPIARNIATFFHNLPEYMPDWRERYDAGTLTIYEMQALFLQAASAYDVLDDWFDSQMKAIPAFGIDVYATPFPHTIGYKIYPGAAQASLLLIRLENLKECAESAMQEFLGLENFVLQNTNTADEKDYVELYRVFKETPLPADYVAKIYKTQFARHFYTNAELDTFTKYWTRSAEIKNNSLYNDTRLAEIEKSVHLLTSQIVEKWRSIRILEAQVSEKALALEALSTQLTKRDLELSEIKSSKAWRLAMVFRRIRLWLVPPNSLRSKVIRRLFNVFISLFRKVTRRQNTTGDLTLIRSSKLFDADWYLANNPDVASTQTDPASHYLYHGGFEGRDPSADFSSSWYLDTYVDVKKVGINPLVHFLKNGQDEGRSPHPSAVMHTDAPYKCPVCQQPVNEFLPLPAFYTENLQKHGFPYARDEGETINFEQYSCPHCGANDRDRLYACYLAERLPQYNGEDQVFLLDIAPSSPLSSFIKKFPRITHRTADLLVAGTDLVIDITNMPEVASNSYDILICSHVLEHVNDDKKALSELYRVLKPGGWGIIMVPIILTLDQIDEDPQITDVAERWRRFGQDDHVRLYNKSGFIERVKNAGFFVNQLGMDYFGETIFKEYGITSKSILYIAEKKAKNG